LYKGRVPREKLPLVKNGKDGVVNMNHVKCGITCDRENREMSKAEGSSAVPKTENAKLILDTEGPEAMAKWVRGRRYV